MKGPSIDQVVYDYMFPKPKPTDPQNFQGLLQRSLVPEVRLETQAFYGHLSSQEAKYPGLDYSFQPHRNRLSRYPWHRRLFRAFDSLGITKAEIANLTKWEGTRWAKERFEREQGIVIRDTTADDIADWIEPELRVPAVPQSAQRAEVEAVDDLLQRLDANENDMEEDEEEEDEEDSDAEMQSVGVELNERLQAAAAQREAGNSVVMDEAWEQWLKEAVEAGNLPFFSPGLGSLSPNANVPGTRPATNSSPPPLPRLLETARRGHWSRIPEVLHSFVRQELERLEQEATRGEQVTRRQLSSEQQAFLLQQAAYNHTRPFGRRPSIPTSRTQVATTTPPNVASRTSTSSREGYARRPILPNLPSPSASSLPTIRAPTAGSTLPRGVFGPVP